MLRVKTRLCLLAAALAVIASAMPYTPGNAVGYAEDWWNRFNTDEYENYTPNGGDCTNFVSQCLRAGFGGSFTWLRRHLISRIAQLIGTCRWPRAVADQHGCIVNAPALKDWLTYDMQCPCRTVDPNWQLGDVPSWLRPGDVVVTPGPPWWHAVIVCSIIDGRPKFAAHTNPAYNEDLWDAFKTKEVTFIHVGGLQGGEPTTMVNGCRFPRYYTPLDSIFRLLGVRHKYICCWHENLGQAWPWTANPTAYACLSWSETNGVTWDTLISSRMNFAGCTDVVFRQAVLSNLLHGGGKTIEVRGSTDDGATWPFLLGDDLLQEAQLPWATYQRNVRLAWIYNGPVQAGRYWCIDDLTFFAKPGRNRDICVTEVRAPKWAITMGKPVSPAIHVVNAGLHDDSLTLTVGIAGTSYSHQVALRAYAYFDTVVEFPSVALPAGDYTTTAYCNAAGDENRANDTAVLGFRVVGDTWVSRYPVYANDPGAGACLASVADTAIYCVTGRDDFFAKFEVDRNLWRNRAPAPQRFGLGGGLAYSGGEYIYGLRGGASKGLYAFRPANNTWYTRASSPEYIGAGGTLAWGGGDYLYAFQGRNKRGFLRYSITSNTWTDMESVPHKPNRGASLVWGGGNYLYALTGGDSAHFLRYNISLGLWSSLAPSPRNAYYGACLTYSPVANKVYAFFGNHSRSFYVYYIDGDSWSPRRQTPNPIWIGGCLAYADYSLFGSTGCGSSDNFWRYSPDDIVTPETPDPPPPPPPPPPDSGVLWRAGVSYPVYSPTTGLSIAFLSEDDSTDLLSLHTIGHNGENVFPLNCGTSSLEPGPPSWSPDEQWLVAAGEAGLLKVAAAESVSADAVILDSGIVSSPDWSDDGAWIVYSRWDGNHKLYKVRPDGTDRTCLTTGEEDYLCPSWSPDAQSIVCMRQRNDVYQLYLVGASTGAETAVTSGYYDNTDASFTPDGQWIVFARADPDGFKQVYKIRSSGQDETQLTFSAARHLGPQVAPGGGWAIYSVWPTDETSVYYDCSYIEAVNLETGELIPFTEANATRVYPSWAPDDSSIVYTMGSGDGGGENAGPGTAICKLKVNLTRRGAGAATGLPSSYVLFQNQPNPFAGGTSIRYGIPKPAKVRLQVCDLTGRVVRVLTNRTQKPGYYTVRWDGKDQQGRRAASGVYFYELETDGKPMARKMLHMR